MDHFEEAAPIIGGLLNVLAAVIRLLAGRRKGRTGRGATDSSGPA